MYKKSITDVTHCILVTLCLLVYFACNKDCPELYTCDEKEKLFYGDWVNLKYIDVFSDRELVFTRTFKSSLFFKDKVGTKKYSFFSDSTCFNWFIDCNQDSITLREDPSCMGKTYVFADEDTYFIEKYSSTEIKLLKYFEQKDSSGMLLKHFERYVLLK